MHGLPFFGNGVADLAFQIELFLAAHFPLALQAVGRVFNGLRGCTCLRLARQLHRWHHILAARMGLLRSQHRLGRLHAGNLLGLRRRTPRGLSRARKHGKQGLAQVTDLAVAQNRVVVDDRSAVIDTGNILRRQHGHHIRHGAHSVQVQPQQTAMGNRRQAQCAVQGACQLGHVVNVGGLTCHMQRGRFVGTADADAASLLQCLRFRIGIDAQRLVVAVMGKGFCTRQ
ncbi:hypothetical protein D3C72_1179600 [compost metagenome]